MSLTQRQEDILDTIVEEYIGKARPISSQILERKYDFGICPATIRTEMQRLTKKGYLVQPHTSAGRVPTDKGYRFFVDKLFSLDIEDFDKSFINELPEMKQEMEDSLKFVQLLTKSLALSSSNLVISYLSERDFFWREGWQELFQEPEFKDFAFGLRFVKMVDSLEKEMKELILNDFPRPRIYIGKENPVSRFKDFSIILSGCFFPKTQKGGLVILGPKRMSYQKNISLINSAVKFLEE